MKILLISNMYPNEIYPNYGVFVKNTEKILLESGYDIKKIIMYKNTNSIFKILNYIIYYLKILLVGFFSKYDFIYIHYAAHNSIPLLILKKLNPKIKLCINVHGSDVVPESKIHMFLQRYVKVLLMSSDLVITPSQYYKNLIKNKYKLIYQNIKVFPSGGINKKVFYRYNENISICEKKQKYIGYIGRIDYKKGWDIFLNLISIAKQENILTDYKFIIVGNGKELSQYEELVKELNIQNLIVKYDLIPQDKLREIYNSIDLFCFTTMREGESLGLVGLEAMACGVPVIGSSIGGLKDYLQDGFNGYFFEPGDAQDLKDKVIRYIYKTELEKEQFRKNAIMTAEKYEVNTIKKILIDIFDEFIKNK